MTHQPDQQLDLLDFIAYTDGGRQGAPPPPPEVTQCRWCHHSEPNGLLLRNNHTPDSYRAIQTTWCIAMECSRKSGGVVYAASSWMCLNPSSYSCGVK